MVSLPWYWALGAALFLTSLGFALGTMYAYPRGWDDAKHEK